MNNVLPCWVVQRKSKTGKNRQWKIIRAETSRRKARIWRNDTKLWYLESRNFRYRVRKAKIVVEN